MFILFVVLKLLNLFKMREILREALLLFPTSEVFISIAKQKHYLGVLEESKVNLCLCVTWNPSFVSEGSRRYM